MTARIEGIGLVTPLGRNPAALRDAVLAGAAPAIQSLRNPFLDREFPAFLVDPLLVEDAARLPRLRRAGAISHFAVAAALDAMKHVQCEPGGERLALVFATTNGGVIHTRRFFDDVTASGTQAGSPALFPETVYNAPASHIAATLGITGVVTTLVNDATAGLDAIAAGCELLECEVCDRCLVVAAEEADWVVGEACAAWGLAEANVAPLGEGAAALVLTREARGLLVSSASGQRLDKAGAPAVSASQQVAHRFSLGEAFAASAAMQVALAALLLDEGQRALVTATGFHGQQAAVCVENRGL